MSPRGWHLDIRATTAVLSIVLGAVAGVVVVLAGPAGQSPDSAAAIVVGLLTALATLLRNTSDALPAPDSGPQTPTPPGA